VPLPALFQKQSKVPGGIQTPNGAGQLIIRLYKQENFKNKALWRLIIFSQT
jgi:hypothetical protein